MDPKTCYGFSIQAISDKYRNSEWTDPVNLCLSDYVVGLSNGVGEGAERVCVYDMNGIMVSECKTSELDRLKAQGGIYIVKFNGGKVRKVIINR